ncbi:MAG: helix-turn-helix domain-containing protein [Enterocloster aldenensis]
MNERIKELRKSLGLTQEKFANRIGIKRNTLANYEIGRNEPIDGIVFSICREFNVNEDWLRTGEGEMFEQLTDQQKVMKHTAQLLKDTDSVVANAIKTFIVTYEQLDATSKKVLEEVALKYLDNMKKGQ